MIRISLNRLSCASPVWKTDLLRNLQSGTGKYGAKPLSITSSRKLISLLNETERAILLSELEKSCRSQKKEQFNTPPPEGTVFDHDETTGRSLSRIVFMANSLPFIGFGFLDNAIMVIAVGVSSALFLLFLTAAGLGNTISDMFGIGMVGYVERFAARIGVHLPQDMTAEEMASGSVRWFTMLGRLTGITIGCLLGMLPLLFFPATPTDCEKAEKRQ